MTTREEPVDPVVVQAGATNTQGAAGTPRHPSSTHMRKDALLQKHGRTNSQVQFPPSSTSTTTTSNNSNHTNNRRHSHTVTHTKTRPMMRSVSNQSQEQRQQQSSTASTTGASATSANKSERRSKASTTGGERKRRPKFVCGDHADEEPSSDQLLHTHTHTHQHHPRIHGVGRRKSQGGEDGEEAAKEEEEKGSRDLEHDGYHPYHPPRHKHDPYPVSPSFSHPPPLSHQQHLHRQQQLTEVRGVGGEIGNAGGQNSHAHSKAAAVSSQQGNMDLERGPNSESIPNNSQRTHLLARPSSTPPIQGKKDQQQQQQQVKSDIAVIRLTAPDDMIPTTETTTAATQTKEKSPSSYSHTPDSDVSVTQAKLTNLALEKDEHLQHHRQQEQRGQRQQGDGIPKDTIKEGMHMTTTTTTATTTPRIPELVVHNSSTSTSTVPSPTPNEAAGVGAGVGAAGVAGGAGGAGAGAVARARDGADSPSLQYREQRSERLSRLLNPSLSTTSLPSLSKTTSRPVLAIISPQHHHGENFVDNDTDSITTSHKKGSSPTPSQQDPSKATTTMPTSSSAVDLASKLLHPVVKTLGRSRSQSSLQSMFSSAFSGSTSTSSTSTATATGRRHHHTRHGSAASLAAASIQSNPGISTSSNALGFMTSPPRIPDPNVYLISRFITPASQAVFSSSVPKQQMAGSFSSGGSGASGAGVGNGSGSGGSMAARRRLPASLRMTSSDVDVTTGNMSTNAPNATTPTTATTPPSPGAASTYSSAEGPGLGPANTNTGTSIYSSSSSSSYTPTASPWNPVEATSRTQQKLNLQRDSSHDDLDEQEMTRREKMLREMERIQREYKCIRMTADPVLESMTRCLAVQKLQQQRRRYNDGALGLGVDEQQKQRSL